MIKDDDPKKKADATQQQVFSEEDINAAGAAEQEWPAVAHVPTPGGKPSDVKGSKSYDNFSPAGYWSDVNKEAARQERVRSERGAEAAAAKKGAAGKIGFTPKLTDKEISDPNIAPSGSHDGLGSPYYAQRVFMKGKDGGPAKVTDGFRRRLLRYLDGLETREEREKREKREARNRMFAAIGDGISAISNLFTTKAGAPNMYDHSKGMTQAYDARLEQLRKERKAREDEFLNAYKMFDRADRDDYSKSYTDAKVANIASQIEAREKKAENDKALAEARVMRQQSLRETDAARKVYWETMADKLEAGRPYWEASMAADAEYKQALAKLTSEKVNTEKTVQGKNEKQGDAAVVRAKNSGKGSGSGGGKKARSESSSGGGSGVFAGKVFRK